MTAGGRDWRCVRICNRRSWSGFVMSRTQWRASTRGKILRASLRGLAFFLWERLDHFQWSSFGLARRESNKLADIFAKEAICSGVSFVFFIALVFCVFLSRSLWTSFPMRLSCNLSGSLLFMLNAGFIYQKKRKW